MTTTALQPARLQKRNLQVIQQAFGDASCAPAAEALYTDEPKADYTGHGMNKMFRNALYETFAAKGTPVLEQWHGKEDWLKQYREVFGQIIADKQRSRPRDPVKMAERAARKVEPFDDLHNR